jgi:diguanylate cyclase (GGDEF)-like protein
MASVPHDRSLAQQLSEVFSLFGVLVAAGFILTATAYAVSLLVMTPEFDRSRLALAAEGEAATAMLDEANGLRGYLLSRDVRYLERYTRGIAVLARANESVVMNTESRPQQAMLKTLVAETRWHEDWAAAAADARAGAIAPSLSVGTALFDTYRDYEATFASELAQRTAVLRIRERRLIAARVTLDLLLFVVVFLLALRQHRALRETIVNPVASLLAHIDRVRGGRLEATVDPAGPRELRQLGEGLNTMVTALADARAAAESRDEIVRHHSVQLRLILDASREFSESLNLRYVVDSVRKSTTAVGGYSCVTVWLMNDDQKRLVNAEEATSPLPPNTFDEMRHGLAARAAKSGRITFEEADHHVRFDDNASGKVLGIAIPLIVGARVVGALEARHDEAKVVTRRVVEVLEMLATHAATAIESARLHEVIEARSHVDTLTRLFNRQRLEEDLEAECKRCMRYERPLAFVMLDVDNFMAFNDAHGHAEADMALQEVARVIAGCVRATDTAYRYGGDEFCILLRETTSEDAMNLAERIRHRVEERFAVGGVAGITASFGVAEFSSLSPAPRALVEAADAAMYESKRSGKNLVTRGTTPTTGGGRDDALKMVS